MNANWTRILGSTVLLLAAGAITAGCGGAKSVSANTGATGSFAAFQACMKEQGVDLPAGGGPPGGGPNGGQPPTGQAPPAGVPGGAPGAGQSAETQKAMEACRSKMPQGGGRPQMTAAQREAMTARNNKFRACLKKAGVTLPTRTTGQPGAGGQAPAASPQLTADQQTAMQSCAQSTGGGGFGGPGGGGFGGPGGGQGGPPGGPGGGQGGPPGGGQGAPAGTAPAA